MKEIKLKDFINDWKNIILESAIYAYQICKMIYKRISYSLKLVPWKSINPYLVVLTIIGFGLHYNNIIQGNNLYTKQIVNQNNILSTYIDSVQVDCEYNALEIKAGEYAMHSHQEHSDITKDSIASLLIELNAWYPDIVMSQIEIESGFGTSALARNNNNIIGMRKTSSRRTTQLKGVNANGYGVYNNWESCVIDRILWDHARFGSHKPTRSQYVAVLNKIYASTGSYGTAVNSNAKKYRYLF